MTRKVNYEDDIFALTLAVRELRDVARLELDGELFREKVCADISFVDATAGRILAGLRASPFLVRRDEHLRELARLKRAFAVLLELLAEGRSALAVSLGEKARDFLALAQRQGQEADEVDRILAGAEEVPPEERRIVSAEELRILIAPDEEQ